MRLPHGVLTQAHLLRGQEYTPQERDHVLQVFKRLDRVRGKASVGTPPP